MKKICLVARQNIKKPNGGGYHNDEGRYALDGIRYGAVPEFAEHHEFVIKKAGTHKQGCVPVL